MPGTISGGQKAADTNRKKYGKDFYARIGKKGGKLGTTGGFAAGEEGRSRARKFGAIGGRISRRRKATAEVAVEAQNVETPKQEDFELAA